MKKRRKPLFLWVHGDMTALLARTVLQIKTCLTSIIY